MSSTPRCWLFCIALLCLLSCSDNSLSSEQSDSPWHISFEEGADHLCLPLSAAWGSASLVVEGVAEGERILVSSDADWLRLRSDTLPADGILAYGIDENTTDVRRTAHLSCKPLHMEADAITLCIEQTSRADDGENGGDARVCLYLGYGYDIYQSLDDAMSVRTIAPILDYYQLQRLGGPATYEVIHDSKLSQQNTNYFSASSLSEFSQTLTASQSNSDFNISGCQRNCDNAVKCCESEIMQQNIGYGSTVKSVAARIIDLGALRHLRDNGRLPFTDEFLKHYREIPHLQAEARQQAIEKLLLKFGTHMVVETTLGGRIDYTFTMRQTGKTYTEEEMREEADYTMGRLSPKERNPSYQHEVSSSKREDGAIRIMGGAKEQRQVLEQDVTQLQHGSQLPPDHMAAWLASINYEENPERSENLEVVHFELYPLWNLVSEDLRTDFIQATLRLASRSDCQVDHRLLGTDLYAIDFDALPLLEFDASPDGSLCRLLYVQSGGSHEPILEVCQEYIPNIRTDARVLVAYPIFNRRIRLNQGVFLGDGIHQPAYVGFSGSNCYVNPIDSLPAGRRISRLFYINGNLHLNNLGVGLYEASRFSPIIADDCLRLIDVETDVLHEHPIVKVGTNFWTRHDIDHAMRFTFYPEDSNEDDILDDFHEGVLFTRFQADVGYWFRAANQWTYGYAPLEYLEGKPNTKWYMPTPQAVTDLYAYIGFNPKSLFRGQASGFEANFNGYLGTVDIEQGNRYFPSGESWSHGKGRLNIICSRNSDDNEAACLMLLDEHYRLRCITDKTVNDKWRFNYYPVRLCRGAFYDYHTAEEIAAQE